MEPAKPIKSRFLPTRTQLTLISGSEIETRWRREGRQDDGPMLFRRATASGGEASTLPGGGPVLTNCYSSKQKNPQLSYEGNRPIRYSPIKSRFYCCAIARREQIDHPLSGAVRGRFTLINSVIYKPTG
jgi:hypothetical protein